MSERQFPASVVSGMMNRAAGSLGSLARYGKPSHHMGEIEKNYRLFFIHISQASCAKVSGTGG